MRPSVVWSYFPYHYVIGSGTGWKWRPPSYTILQLNKEGKSFKTIDHLLLTSFFH